jgi:hypothetical protein
MATTAAVQGAGLVTGVWKKLEKAIFNAGGTEEHLARLDKAETDEAFANFAAQIVRTFQVAFNSFRDMIRAGNYDYTYGFADNPEDIQGQTFHPATNSTELDHPGTVLTTSQVYERYSEKMASFSELLAYGIRHPNVQRRHPVVIVWKDETGQFWDAFLDSVGSRRALDVYRDHSDFQWDADCRFLRRK